MFDYKIEGWNPENMIDDWMREHGAEGCEEIVRQNLIEAMGAQAVSQLVISVAPTGGRDRVEVSVDGPDVLVKKARAVLRR
jgi:hypothetical protein